MRQESCRTCGLDMSPDLRCEICKDFVRLHCPKCGNTTDTQIHIHKNYFQALIGYILLKIFYNPTN